MYIIVGRYHFFFFRLCTSLDWDKDGDLLTVANDKSGKKCYQFTIL